MPKENLAEGHERIQISIGKPYIRTDVVESIRRISIERDCSIIQIVRDALREYVQKYSVQEGPTITVHKSDLLNCGAFGECGMTKDEFNEARKEVEARGIQRPLLTSASYLLMRDDVCVKAWELAVEHDCSVEQIVRYAVREYVDNHLEIKTRAIATCAASRSIRHINSVWSQSRR